MRTSAFCFWTRTAVSLDTVSWARLRPAWRGTPPSCWLQIIPRHCPPSALHCTVPGLVAQGTGVTEPLPPAPRPLGAHLCSPQLADRSSLPLALHAEGAKLAAEANALQPCTACPRVRPSGQHRLYCPLGPGVVAAAWVTWTLSRGVWSLLGTVGCARSTPELGDEGLSPSQACLTPVLPALGLKTFSWALGRWGLAWSRKGDRVGSGILSCGGLQVSLAWSLFWWVGEKGKSLLCCRSAALGLGGLSLRCSRACFGALAEPVGWSRGALPACLQQ